MIGNDENGAFVPDLRKKATEHLVLIPVVALDDVAEHPNPLGGPVLQTAGVVLVGFRIVVHPESVTDEVDAAEIDGKEIHWMLVEEIESDASKALVPRKHPVQSLPF